MPSWTEKPHVIPTINVNLKKCDCLPSGTHPTTDPAHVVIRHQPTCAAAPVLIPCHIPRSVTFTVTLGECCCEHFLGLVGRERAATGEHEADCPARPIRVACSISGETWAASFVDGADFEPVDGARRLIAVCDERWALMKALVLTPVRTAFDVFTGPLAGHIASGLVARRDAVFAALAKRVRAEDAGDEAMAEFFAEVPGSVQVSVGRRITERLSESALAAYVEHLIEQVGVLS